MPSKGSAGGFESGSPRVESFNKQRKWITRAGVAAGALGLVGAVTLQATREPNRAAVDTSIAAEATVMAEMLGADVEQLSVSVGSVLVRGMNVRETPAVIPHRTGFEGFVAPKAGNLEHTIDGDCYLIARPVSIELDGQTWFGFVDPADGLEEFDAQSSLNWIHLNEETDGSNIYQVRSAIEKTTSEFSVNDANELVDRRGALLATARSIDCVAAWETLVANGDIPATEESPFTS